MTSLSRFIIMFYHYSHIIIIFFLIIFISPHLSSCHHVLYIIIIVFLILPHHHTSPLFSHYHYCFHYYVSLCSFLIKSRVGCQNLFGLSQKVSAFIILPMLKSQTRN